MNQSESYYNKIANKYKLLVEARINYLNAVDDFVIKSKKNQAVDSYLDIGSGDGRRALKIARTIGIKGDVVLVDNSVEMLSNIDLDENVIVYNDDILNYNESKKFKLITCLWNVLGHFPSKESRIKLFKHIEDLLDDKGVFIFDVNNRYNILHYGFSDVAKNLEKDHQKIKDSGWFTLGETYNKTRVYMHSPFDIFDYIKETNLIIEETKYFDYSTGQDRETYFEGQLLYKIRKHA